MSGILHIKKYRGDGYGLSWPNSPSGTGTIRDVFGPRPFYSHIATVGYDYDFHRGVDINMNVGDTIYAPMNGAICRLHYTHFGWQDSSHLDQFTLVAPSNSLSVSLGIEELLLTCSRVGAVSFPSSVDKYQANREYISPIEDDWTIEINFSNAISTTGSIGIGIFNTDNTEYVAMDYDGATFTVQGKGTATFATDGYTFSVASQTWMRIEYTYSTNTFAYKYSVDGSAWTTLTSETGKTFAYNIPYMIPTIYWKSADTNATPYTIHISQFNWYDAQNISRFGNWITIQSPLVKIMLMHFSVLNVNLGDFVSVGQILGKVGSTGFDARSGRVSDDQSPHIEFHTNNKYAYVNSEAINALDSILLPRINVSNNVSVIRSTGNDPDGNDSHVLTITVYRQNEDFDLNEVSLTGNSATRTVNWNTRAGLNSDVDIPKQNGVYQVPSAFDENANSYDIIFYFKKSTVGSTFVSYIIKDTQGNTLASE